MVIADIIGIEVLVALRIWYDVRRISKGKAINHFLSGLVQVTVCAGLGMACAVGIWGRVALFLFNLALFWLQFDYLLNFFRGLRWDHLGSAWTDQILKNEPLLRLSLKILLAVGFGILFYLI